jgi:hypothetical protein
MSNGTEEPGDGRPGSGSSSDQGTEASFPTPPDPLTIAVAAAVGGLVGGLVGALIGSGLG